MKISNVLWKAANEKLWGGNGRVSLDTDEYSCFAVLIAAGKYRKYARGDIWSISDFGKFHCPTLTFLEELGCDSDADRQFDEFKAGKARQGARYLWLMFAYIVALDEGL